ncbi:MAG: PAS domain S-box protein [Deltaproteobacteria bacterium]|nr:PAS domain S-box protein [Deltaproteobacteria bacterium]MBW1953086.1 PAS domain S-box protein [Deltaproteobacteria bacterium]MBW1987183.1 PAS domain S-box protein [Deltaproteobacteria bacterium]MBW2135045.1 PAS domain S-box protein [Deltaproteobacteria bacterium]
MDIKHSIKMAVIGGSEAIEQLRKWPAVCPGVCPIVQLTLFDPVQLGAPASLRELLGKLDPAGFDLIIDLRQSSEVDDLLAGIDPAKLVRGASAGLIQNLLSRLQEVCQQWEIQKGIIDSATDAIVTINEDHIIVGYNKGAEKIFGFTREEALGQDLEIIIPPPYKKEHKEYVRRYIATRKARVIGKHVRLSAQRKNGQEFPMSISFSMTEIAEKLYFTGIIRDITESMDIEAKLRQSERLAAVGNTVSHIVHEIKNPLMVIGGFARQLARAPNLDDKARDKLAMITEEVKRLESLMFEMKDFSHPPTIHLEAGRIEEVIQEVLELYEDTLREQGIKVLQEYPQSLPTLSFDRQQIKQVIINLIKNAAEAMPQGGQLTVATRCEEPYLEIAITDTGEGMPSEVVEKIFTPYYTTKTKGSGLGLSICRNIIKAHNGDIMVNSIPGKGSTFTILLPMDKPAPEKYPC